MILSPQKIDSPAETGTGTTFQAPRPALPPASRWWTLLVFFVYLAIALFAYRHLLNGSSLPACACGDQAQEVNFLAWGSFAVTHGHNPFFTSWTNYPTGLNLAVNTSFPLLSFIAIPAVLTIGPVASYILLLVAGFALSALAMYVLLRRWMRWPFAAFVGGLLYGFSPYMIGQGWSHLFLTFVPIPPLILLVLDEILVRQTRNVRWLGVALGALATVQYYVSPEILTLTAVATAIGIVILAAMHWRLVPSRLPYVLRAFGYGVLVCAPMIAYPVWFGFFGPAHIVGPPLSLKILEKVPGDLLGGIAPTAYQHFAPAHFQTIGNRLSSGDVVENGMYLGIPLILIVTVITVVCRRVRGVVFFFVMLVVCYVLSLGSRLYIDNHNTQIRMPFTILVHIPIIQDVLPVRFSLFTAFFAGLILAIGLDRCYQRLRARSGSRHLHVELAASSPWAAGLLTVLVGAAALIPLVPQLPYRAAATDIPSLFTSPSIDNIPTGSVVLSYPYPGEPEDQIYLPQATSEFRFKIVGGPGHVPALPKGTSPSRVQGIFQTAYSDTALAGNSYPPLSSANLDVLRTFLKSHDIDTIVVYPVGSDPGGIERFVTALLGPPQWDRQVFAWFGVEKELGAAKP